MCLAERDGVKEQPVPVCTDQSRADFTRCCSATIPPTEIVRMLQFTQRRQGQRAEPLNDTFGTMQSIAAA